MSASILPYDKPLDKEIIFKIYVLERVYMVDKMANLCYTLKRIAMIELFPQRAGQLGKSEHSNQHLCWIKMVAGNPRRPSLSPRQARERCEQRRLFLKRKREQTLHSWEIKNMA